MRNAVAISGATNSTYTLVNADAGTQITYHVTATSAGGTASATSSAVSVAASSGNSTPGVFDVTTYGAVADSNGTAGNGTDNKDAIDAAIAACKAAGGGKVLFPAGKFRTTAIRHLVDFGNITIEGAGVGQAELVHDFAQWGWIGGAFLVDGYDGSGNRGYVNNVTVRNLTLSTPVGKGQDATPRDYPADPRYQQELDIAPSTPLTLRGVKTFTLENIKVLRSIVWSVNPHDCWDGTVKNVTCQDAYQDGIHYTGGCQRVTNTNCSALNVGDDGFAIGFQPTDDVNEDISFVNCTVDGAGAYGFATYAPANRITITGHTINSTWLGGIKTVPAQLGSRSSFVYRYTSVNNVTVGAGTMTNIGFRPATAQYRNQGDGVTVGILADTGAGGSVTNLTIAAQNMSQVRNAFVARSGSVTNATLASGGTYTGLVIGGAGAASNPPSGYSRDMPGSYSLISPYVAPGATLAQDNLDATAHPAVTPASTTFTTTSGGRTIIPGSGALIGFANNKMVFGAGAAYPFARIDTGLTTHDFEIAYHGDEGVYIAVGSNETTGQAVVADCGGGGFYARNAGPPIAGSSVSFPVITGPDHLVRVRLTATQAFMYLDGGLKAQIDLPTSGWTAGTNVTWGVYSGNSAGPSGTGFNQLTVAQ